MAKRAYLVLGPESSGTRLLTRILIAAGCYGDDGHEQRLDSAIPDEPLLVWRRSLPHDKQWPDIAGLVGLLRLHGYAVTAIVSSRDWHAMALSQVQAPHAPDVSTALVQIQQAYLRIFAGLRSTATPFRVVNYEALVMRVETSIRLLEHLGLPAEARIEVHDGNAKHYATAPALG
jgi:hypothetical protein